MKNTATTVLGTMEESTHSVQEILSKWMKVTMAFAIIIAAQLIGADGVLAQSSDDSKSTAIADTLKKSEINTYGDYSVQDALYRMPGVQVNQYGEFNIRGAGYGNFYAMINGQRASITSQSGRSFDFSFVPLEMVQEIQLIKVLSPDMFADGLAGAINLKTFTPVTGERYISGGIGGGLSSEYNAISGPEGRAWVSYAEAFNDTVSMSLDLNYQRGQNTYESLGMMYGVQDFGSGNEDVLEQFSTGLNSRQSDRFGANLRLDFTPTDHVSYFVNGMVNIGQMESALNQNTWGGNGNWSDPNTTPNGFYNYNLNYESREITQYNFQAGADLDFDSFGLNIDAGWSQSNVDRTVNRFPFRETFLEYTVNDPLSTRPTITPTDPLPEPEDMRLLEMNYIIDDYISQKISGKVEAEIPFSLGEIKLGSDIEFSEKDANDRGAYSNYHYTYQGFLDLSGFETQDIANYRIFDSYHVSPLLDVHETLSFFETSIPNMRLDDRAYYADSEVYNHFADEQIYAGYGMAIFNLDALTLIAGARVEHAVSDNEARKVTFNRFGQFEEATDTSTSISNTNIFPNAQLLYEINDQAKVQLAYSKTITRPDYNYISPFELATPQDTSLFTGNPDLKPVTSDNIDLFVDFSTNNGGYVSVGGYYKMISDYIVQQENEVQIQRGEREHFDGLIPDDENSITAYNRTYQNSGNTSTVYGVEVAVGQRFNFLPGALADLGTTANYTWSQSDYETSRNETLAMPGQSPHVVNAALNFQGEQLFAQVAYHRSAELMYELADNPRAAPSLGTGSYYLDRYQDGYEDLSASIRYNFSDQVQLWSNIYNLLSNDSKEYAGKSEYYPTSINKRKGIAFNIGVQVNF